jgi:iron complex transport system permease protein
MPRGRFARDSAGRAWAVGLALAAVWGLAFLWALRLGPTGSYDWGEVLGALLGDADDPRTGPIVRWRALRALTALSVGGSLALSGAYLQGLFRNALASPGVLGVTAGSSLGAALAIAVLGGFGPGLVLEAASGVGTMLVTLAALVGALVVLLPLVLVAGRGGAFSVPSLLLAGMAMNALCSGFLAAVQSLTLGDFEVARALFAWAFGTLDDRVGWQVALAGAGLLLGLIAIPFLAPELDLLASGDEDAAALGVAVGRVRAVVLLLAALLAATAVSIAGQILFVGLIAPHLVRLTTGAAHRRLLPLSVLSGGALLLGADCLQRTWLPDTDLRPGVLMSLLGAPFFLFLLARQREALRSW